MYEKKWRTGYVCLPCFTCKWLEGTYSPELTCNRFLSLIFAVFFAPFWNGKVHLKKGEMVDAAAGAPEG